ncbi:MAG: prefoldin subunit alpha [Thermoplasmata archaeon]
MKIMVNQMELQQKANRLEQMRGQVEALKEHKGMIEDLLEEHNQAKETMKKYQEKEEGTEIMVPIGANSYVHSKITDNDQVLIGLGSDLSAERKIDDALEIIERKKDKIKENKEELEEQIEELNQNAQELEQELRKEYQQLQQQQQTQGGGGQVIQ